MEDKNQPKHLKKEDSKNPPLSETIPNAHSSGNGALRLSEDGMIEPSGETIADAEADKQPHQEPEEY